MGSEDRIRGPLGSRSSVRHQHSGGLAPSSTGISNRASTTSRQASEGPSSAPLSRSPPPSLAPSHQQIPIRIASCLALQHLSCFAG